MGTKITDGSFLSQTVKCMLVDIGQECHYKEIDCKHSFLTENGTFDWDNIAPLFGEITDDFKIQNQSKNWFAITVRKLWSVFHEGHQFLLCSDIHSQDLLWNLCAWTGKEQELKKQYELFVTKCITATETSLFLTALLERSLGNVFLLNGSRVPSLLRDLLETPELSAVIGYVPIIFLQILMGTPSALNLRNIVWHGFPRPDEIHPELVSTLFLVAASVGEILNSRSISLDLIPSRTQTHFKPELFAGCFPVLSDQCTEVLNILDQSCYITSSHHSYWENGLKHFSNCRYGYCLQLLLPQLEHLLRCVFCSVNDCPNRMLTAESTTLYTTLNEIMAEQVSVCNEVRENRIRKILGDTILEMLQDLFVHQAGPRIRDKIGHGECDLYDIPKHLVNHVICVVLVIVLKLREVNLSGCDHPLHEHLNYCDSGGSVELLEHKIIHSYKTYFSLYHPSSLLKKSIVTEMQCLDEWKKYPRHLLDSKERSDVIHDVNENLLHLLNIIEKSVGDFVFAIDTTSQSICKHVSSVKIHTIFRPKVESEIISILRHIIDNIHVISSQVNQQLLEKFLSYSQHKMRSRNRETYQRMLETIPLLERTILCVILIVSIWLHKINHVSDMPHDRYTHCLKFLKKILQFVENVAIYSKQDKNRWYETGLLARKFCHDLIQALNTHFYLLKQIYQ
ncbi:endoplasmic reticulum membrane-associated RNA degradation protein [Anabrus simplex]|uniref:endoplasmic reticulum membrane-associated RNA degradation protein n=1 Tax=Anabrus simplex TaxID=316456 RepID=UPI0035A2A124